MTLTVGDLRAHVTTGLTDPALQKLLDAALEAIANRSGGTGAITEFADGGYPVLVLDRMASSITSITETVGGVDVLLDPTDYRASSYIVTRLDTGPNPRSTWAATKTVYVPSVDAADRDRVTIALVKLDLNHAPGVQSEKIGDWEQTLVDNSAMNYGLEREAILASLDAAPSMRVVGG